MPDFCYDFCAPRNSAVLNRRMPWSDIFSWKWRMARRRLWIWIAWTREWIISFHKGKFKDNPVSKFTRVGFLEIIKCDLNLIKKKHIYIRVTYFDPLIFYFESCIKICYYFMFWEHSLNLSLLKKISRAAQNFWKI